MGNQTSTSSTGGSSTLNPQQRTIGCRRGTKSNVTKVDRRCRKDHEDSSEDSSDSESEDDAVADEREAPVSSSRPRSSPPNPRHPPPFWKLMEDKQKRAGSTTPAPLPALDLDNTILFLDKGGVWTEDEKKQDLFLCAHCQNHYLSRPKQGSKSGRWMQVVERATHRCDMCKSAQPWAGHTLCDDCSLTWKKCACCNRKEPTPKCTNPLFTNGSGKDPERTGSGSGPHAWGEGVPLPPPSVKTISPAAGHVRRPPSYPNGPQPCSGSFTVGSPRDTQMPFYPGKENPSSSSSVPASDDLSTVPMKTDSFSEGKNFESGSDFRSMGMSLFDGDDESDVGTLRQPAPADLKPTRPSPPPPPHPSSVWHDDPSASSRGGGRDPGGRNPYRSHTDHVPTKYATSRKSDTSRRQHLVEDERHRGDAAFHAYQGIQRDLSVAMERYAHRSSDGEWKEHGERPREETYAPPPPPQPSSAYGMSEREDDGYRHGGSAYRPASTPNPAWDLPSESGNTPPPPPSESAPQHRQPQGASASPANPWEGLF